MDVNNDIILTHFQIFELISHCYKVGRHFLFLSSDEMKKCEKKHKFDLNLEFMKRFPAEIIQLYWLLICCSLLIQKSRFSKNTEKHVFCL